MYNCIKKTIPYSEMRYKTCGDWWFDADGILQIRVADMGNPRYEFLIASHEEKEAFLCHIRGITTKQVDDFDINFKGEGEPGDDPRAPYHEEHVFSSKLERIEAMELRVDWPEYERVIENLGEVCMWCGKGFTEHRLEPYGLDEAKPRVPCTLLKSGFVAR